MSPVGGGGGGGVSSEERMGQHNPLGDGLNSFQQGLGKLCPREGHFFCISPKKGAFFAHPLTPPIAELL